MTKTTEIERKFLVKNDSFKEKAISKERIVQAYLSTDPERTIRVRIKGNRAFLTIKGKTNHLGTTRFEWEKEIEIEEAEQLLPLCLLFPIEKERYLVEYKGFNYEVDVFFGNNEGLILAELELEDENQFFEKPDWLGDEVTGRKEYYNSFLSKIKRL
ncbi:CYTH domain-containing protein [Capnocytophaga catalasegens]|uniref:CYTH domain-containing protein n=1 Tax=Capnocytophaga catalasegens TaxID=1004260 RepID=A0AAV5APA5_9FLAO|nr:CYTH domain-containing protein [Capnocytophaga catalasegens]GIZ14847.1 CYTH domain-containing protein [Capnocytophaga catalasegens]GJM49184.1 CYTH domain-containing protein [Capnocytophaga catalasegens]GJM52604.1 CYTH domain-containing protein [Capnocytophaga catalasegens]